MDTPTDQRQQIIGTLRRADADAQTILNQADPDAVVYTESGWRVKDLVAHVAAWEEEMLRSLDAFQRGSTYQIADFPGDDAYNGFTYFAHKDDSAEEIYARRAALRQEAIERASALAPDDFTREMAYPWHSHGPVWSLFGSMTGHSYEHLAHIEEATQPNVWRAGFMAKIDSTYDDAVNTLAARDPEQVIYADSGWRVKDLIGHLIDWEQVIFDGLEAYHQGRVYRMAILDFDEFNAVSAQKRWDVPYAQHLADWARIRQRQKGLTRAFTSAQINREMILPWGSQDAATGLFDLIFHHQDEIMTHIIEAAPDQR